MTPQELFDTALLGVIAQDACSYNTEGGEVQCLYRDGKGNKCAAGQLIPDDQYAVRRADATDLGRDGPDRPQYPQPQAGDTAPSLALG